MPSARCCAASPFSPGAGRSAPRWTCGGRRFGSVGHFGSPYVAGGQIAGRHRSGRNGAALPPSRIDWPIRVRAFGGGRRARRSVSQACRILLGARTPCRRRLERNKCARVDCSARHGFGQLPRGVDVDRGNSTATNAPDLPCSARLKRSGGTHSHRSAPLIGELLDIARAADGEDAARFWLTAANVALTLRQQKAALEHADRALDCTAARRTIWASPLRCAAAVQHSLTSDASTTARRASKQRCRRFARSVTGVSRRWRCAAWESLPVCGTRTNAPRRSSARRSIWRSV